MHQLCSDLKMKLAVEKKGFFSFWAKQRSQGSLIKIILA